MKYNIDVECEKSLPLIYDGIELKAGYRLDIIINNKVIIEIKAVSELAGIHKAQILTYLKLTDCKLGLLINFNSELFKMGFKRVINGQLE
jgi:GxxExxY protein